MVAPENISIRVSEPNIIPLYLDNNLKIWEFLCFVMFYFLVEFYK